jgi:tRNA (guanosine-2'-O-)-methyltransferase
MEQDTEKRIAYLSAFVSEARIRKFREVAALRTRKLTVVLEDIYQPHNASAVLRTCDCFGVQDVHIIENRNRYRVNPDVALGASKWLNLIKYAGLGNNTERCLKNLKEKGYKIAATALHQTAVSPEEFTPDSPLALVFGTELKGISPEVEKQADVFLKIPMVGFTESFNISVSAALCISQILPRIKQKLNPWSLSLTEQNELVLEWLRASIDKCDLIEKEFESR